jgi:hypothetical protein
VAARAGSGATRLREEEPAGSVKRRAGELGSEVAQEERRRGSWWPGKTPARCCRKTERGKQEEEDEDLFMNLQNFKEFTVK